MAYENVAESAALLHYFGNKLMYMHFNDNWRLWDDDMTVGSVHTIEMLELLYWLDRLNYTGWYALDIFPYRENGIRAATESIQWIQGLHGLLDKIGRDRIAAGHRQRRRDGRDRDAARGAAGIDVAMRNRDAHRERRWRPCDRSTIACSTSNHHQGDTS